MQSSMEAQEADRQDRLKVGNVHVLSFELCLEVARLGLYSSVSTSVKTTVSYSGIEQMGSRTKLCSAMFPNHQ